MRQILCVVCVWALCAVGLLLASVGAEADDSMIIQMAEDCIKETKATDDDVKNMIGKNLPTTKTGKCLSFCMMKQFNCMNDNGEFQKEEFMEIMKMVVEDETMLPVCEEISNNCVNVTDPNNDNCESAAMILKCLDDGAKAKKLKTM